MMLALSIRILLLLVTTCYLPASDCTWVKHDGDDYSQLNQYSAIKGRRIVRTDDARVKNNKSHKVNNTHLRRGRRKLYKHSEYTVKYGEKMSKSMKKKSKSMTTEDGKDGDDTGCLDGNGDPCQNEANNGGKGKGSSDSSSNSSSQDDAADNANNGPNPEPSPTPDPTPVPAPCPPEAENCEIDLGNFTDAINRRQNVTFEATNLPLAAIGTNVMLQIFLTGDFASDEEYLQVLFGPEQTPLLNENGDPVIFQSDGATCEDRPVGGEWINTTFSALEYNMWQGEIYFGLVLSTKFNACPRGSEVRMLLHLDLLQRCEVCPE